MSFVSCSKKLYHFERIKLTRDRVLYKEGDNADGIFLIEKGCLAYFKEV
jgi:CRP-like cAMP-binding protein